MEGGVLAVAGIPVTVVGQAFEGIALGKGNPSNRTFQKLIAFFQHAGKIIASSKKTGNAHCDNEVFTHAYTTDLVDLGFS